jgi:hypothetical protein
MHAFRDSCISRTWQHKDVKLRGVQVRGVQGNRMN